MAAVIAANRFGRAKDGPAPAARYALPARPAAIFELISISDCIFAGLGLVCSSMVRCMTNSAMFLMFCRTSTG
jgi:hypothetical protein